MKYVFVPLLILGLAASIRAAEPNLVAGFINNDKKPLETFLNSWHAESKPIAQKVLDKKPRFERELYRLFPVFFAPSEFNKDVPFLLVQEVVAVKICDSDLKAIFDARSGRMRGDVGTVPLISEMTVKQFRPSLDSEKHKVLFHNDEHIMTLFHFLVPRYGRKLGGMERIDDASTSGNKVRKRVEFVESHLKVIPGVWGFGFHFATHPEALCVHFNQDYSRAIVVYREGYNGGEVYMEINNGEWVVLDRILSWTE